MCKRTTNSIIQSHVPRPRGEPSRTLGSEETAIPLQTEQEITSVSGAEQEDETKKIRENHTQAIVRMPIAVEQKRTTPSPSPGPYKPTWFCSIFESKYGVTHDRRGRKIFGPTSFQFAFPERDSMQTEAESAQKWYEVGGSVKSRTDGSRIPLGLEWINYKKLWEKDPPMDVRGFNFRLLTSVSSIGLAKTLPARPATVLVLIAAPVRSSPPSQSQRVSSTDGTFPRRQDLVAQESDPICDGVRNPNSAFSSPQETPSSLSANNPVQVAPISHTPSTTWTDAPAPQGSSDNTEARVAIIMNVGPGAAANQPRPPRKRRRLPLFPRNPVFRPVPTLAPVPAQQQRQDDQIVRLYTLDSDGNEGCVVGHWCRYDHRGCRKLLHQTRTMELVKELK